MFIQLTVISLALLLSDINYVRASNSTELGESSDIFNQTMCTEARCIMKCCSENKLVKLMIKRDKKRRVCEVYNGTRHQDITMFNNRLSNYTVLSGIFENPESKFRRMAMDTSKLTDFNFFLTENVELYFEMPNAYHRFTRIANNKFCYDFYERFDEKGEVPLQPKFFVIFDAGGEDEQSRTSSTLLNVAMLVSCFFFIVVLVVYSLLKELRNLCGMILMAYVASMLVSFLLLVVIRIMSHPPKVCLGLTFFIYFALLSSFCWMNVMSFDIWWTFRGYAKARPIHRRGEHFKFMMYCLYAFGLPLAMAIAMVVLNETDMRHIPWFITPKIPQLGCFLEDKEKYLYLYIPMLILIICNWIFYLMTAFNLWRLNRGTAMLDTAAAGTPQAHRTHRQRFLVYLKLSVVMGLNWVLEVVSYKFPNHNIWYITDSYNILIGLAIFLIFVCKRKIYRRLVKRYLVYKESRKVSLGTVYSRSSSDSGSSQETQTLQICTNPKGPGYAMKSF